MAILDLPVTSAALVAEFFGVSEKTVRAWRKQFLIDPDGFGEEHRGKYLLYQLMKDEQFCDQALEWVRANNNITGKKNMTASDFRSCSLIQICQQKLMNVQLFGGSIYLAFSQQALRSVYIDGHERSDIVEYRKVYLKVDCNGKSHVLFIS